MLQRVIFFRDISCKMIANKELSSSTYRMGSKRNYSGTVRDKERTKGKLLTAVGEVFTKHGYNGLTIKRVIETAGVDKRLIYEYFGGFNSLVETYLRQKDYWYGFNSDIGEAIENSKPDYARKLSETILINQFDRFYNDQELQQILRWQLSENSPAIHDLRIDREKIASLLFSITDPFFEGSSVDLRAVAALLVGGIYSIVLHSKTSDTPFCEIDVNTPDGMRRIKAAISKIIEGTYKAVEDQRQSDI